MRTIRIVVSLGVLGVFALGGYHVAARAGTFVASTVSSRDDRSDLADRFPDLSQRSYQLANLSILEATLAQVSVRYVDPERIDYAAMFKAGLEAVEHECPEAVLRIDGDRLHVSVDRYTTVLQLRPLESPEDVVAESRRVAQILETQLPKADYDLHEVEYTLVNGMLSTLDPHTVLLPPVAAKKMEEDNGGSFGGLGISIKMDKGELMIEYPMVGTPAARAGLKPQDKIVKIEGEGTFNMDIEDAVSKMRGPVGTSVTISIQREGMDIPRDVKLVRADIKPAAVWSELLDGNIGYVEIPQFHQLVSGQLDAELASLARQAGPGGLKGVILDMRDNPGGYLQQAIQVSDKFLTNGVIVSTVAQHGSDREETEAKKSGTEPDYPMAVLMSGNSASAAEIVAGALKNQERAVIIGERSFGKGSVQEIMGMEGDAELKLTVRRYLTPGDRSIQEIGIPPDIELKRSYVAPPRLLKEYNVMSGPRISLFARDHILREADLNGHFTNSVNLETPPVYSLRYLTPLPEDDDTKSDRKDVKSDFEVLIARDVLLAAHGGRRADVLRAAENVVGGKQKKQDAAISEEFAKQKIDWSACVNPAAATVDLKLDFAKTGTNDWGSKLAVDGLSDLRATVTNRGSTPLCQLIARAESPDGNDIVDGVEFYFGKVQPGETRTYTTRAKIPGGYPTEVARVDLKLTDWDHHELAQSALDVTTQGDALPRYAWEWSVDDKAGGDGDGLPEVGEIVALKYTVSNVGEGVGGEVTFNLRKDPSMGKAVELKEARFTSKALAPGASTKGTLSVRVATEPPEGQLLMEVSVRDNERFDYASVTRAGFYAYYVHTEKVAMPLGKPVASVRREPPKIEITRSPGNTSADPTVTISGVASDDRGVRDVIVYQGQRKLAYAGGGDASAPVPTVPFTASAELEEGNNILVIAVRDVDGFTTTAALDVAKAKAVASTTIEGKPANP